MRVSLDALTSHGKYLQSFVFSSVTTPPPGATQTTATRWTQGLLQAQQAPAAPQAAVARQAPQAPQALQVLQFLQALQVAAAAV